MGQRDFGENRVQEMQEKHQMLPSDIRWHLIGHLQSNKVKFIAPFVHLIHSVDSFNLLLEIDRQAEKSKRIQDCLLQFHIAEEETKFGLDESEAIDLIRQSRSHPLTHVRLCGVMGMATLTPDEAQVRAEFRCLKSIFDRLKTTYFSDADYFCEISMGMSGDYRIAVEEGSTIVRIGSLIFGNRN
jgi:hypothetical protein